MKKYSNILTLSFLLVTFTFSACKKDHAIACPSYWNGEGGDTRGTPLEKGADGKIAPEGANVRKSGNGIVQKKKDKHMNANYYRGKKKSK
jgi:hypothetical protein